MVELFFYILRIKLFKILTEIFLLLSKLYPHSYMLSYLIRLFPNIWVILDWPHKWGLLVFLYYALLTLLQDLVLPSLPWVGKLQYPSAEMNSGISETFWYSICISFELPSTKVIILASLQQRQRYRCTNTFVCDKASGSIFSYTWQWEFLQRLADLLQTEQEGKKKVLTYVYLKK